MHNNSITRDVKCWPWWKLAMMCRNRHSTFSLWIQLANCKGFLSSCFINLEISYWPYKPKFTCRKYVPLKLVTLVHYQGVIFRTLWDFLALQTSVYCMDEEKNQVNITQDCTLHSDIEDPVSNKKVLWMWLNRKKWETKILNIFSLTGTWWTLKREKNSTRKKSF